MVANTPNDTTSLINNSENLIYIASFLGSVIIVNWLGGEQTTFYYLVIILIGMAMMYINKFKIVSIGKINIGGNQ